MAKILPLNLDAGDLGLSPQSMVIAPRPRPRTVSSASRASTTGFTRQSASGNSSRSQLHSERAPPSVAHSECWAPGERLLAQSQAETLVHRRLRDRLGSVRSALRERDRVGTGLVGLQEFTEVLQSLLGFSQAQLSPLMSTVCRNNSVTIDYTQFLRRYSRAGSAHRADSHCGVRNNSVTIDYTQFLRRYSRAGSAHRADSHCGVRQAPGYRLLPLSEVQRLLKNKIGGNLRAMVCMFRVFDYKREGRVQRQDFRRIMEKYCFPMTDKEFGRVWNHYSPGNTADISYKVFLDQLELGSNENLNVNPFCSKMELSSPQGVSPDRVRQKTAGPGPGPAGQMSSGHAAQDRTRGLTSSELHSLFHREMCLNCAPVWQTLQASDANGSGLVKREVLRAVLCNFLFPMSPHIFHQLTSRYGVKATGSVRWKFFLGHFLDPMGPTGAAGAPPHINRTLEQGTPLYLRLKEIFHLLDRDGRGWVTRADLRLALELPHFHLTAKARGPSGTDSQAPGPRLSQARVRELLNLLDPEHTGLVHLPSLERLLPQDVSTPLGRTDMPPSPASALEIKERQDGEREAAEGGTRRGAERTCTASPSSSKVERQKLLVSLPRCDHEHVDTHAHFDKLCDSLSDSGPGDHDRQASYIELRRLLGIQLQDGSHSTEGHHTEQASLTPQTPPHSTCSKPRCPSGPAGGPVGRRILDIVFKRMKERLEQRHTTLAERIQATTHSLDGTICEKELRKILEDSWIILENRHFHQLIRLLGFQDGRLDRSAFQSKYEEFSSGAWQQDGEGNCGDGRNKAHFLTTEACLDSIKAKMHGDSVAAFKLMDKDSDGLVDACDFSALYRNLGLVARGRDYQRLLHLIGLRPGAKLSYAEFLGNVQNGGVHKQKQHTLNVLDQINEELVSHARYNWVSLSQALCQPEEDGQGFIYKSSLRNHLFTFDLPLRPAEFDQLWLRYDPDECGHVTVSGFLDTLGVERKGKSERGEQEVDSNKDHPEGDILAHLASAEALELKVSMDKGGRKLASPDFLSAFEQNTERESQRPPKDPPPVRHVETLNSLGLDRSLSQLQELVTASAPVLYKAFSTFDPLGTGMIEALEFRRILESICARLSDNQYRHVLTKLDRNWEHQTINWKGFLSKFKSGCRPVTRGGVERRSKEDFRSLCEHHSPRLTSDQEIPVSASGKLHAGDFLRRFGAAAGPAPRKKPLTVPACTSPELGERASSTRSNTFHSKTAAVFPRPQSAPHCSFRVSSAAGSRGTGSPPGDRKWRFCGGVRQCWKDIKESCAEEHHHRDGRLRLTSSPDVVQSFDVTASPDKLEAVSAKYDMANDGRISHPDFLRQFLLNLKPPETERPFQRRCRLPPPTGRSGGSVLTGQCVEAMLKIRQAVRLSWSAMRRSFMTFDPSRKGSISMQDFRKVLQRSRVNLSEEDFFHLSSYFDASAAGTICYNDFLRAYLR